MTKSPFELLNEFMKENPKSWQWENIGTASRHIKTFLRWTASNRVELSAIDQPKINKFILYLVEQKYDHERRYQIRLFVFYFLEWLYRKDYPIRDPWELFPHKKPRSQFIDVKLPEMALEFIDLVGSRVKTTSLQCYKTAIRHFHRFLSENHLCLRDIDRPIMERFFKYIVDRKQAPTTRIGTLVQVRLYLMWLNERGIIKYDSTQLVNWRDMPKRPEYLPRPIPPKFDRLIQKRLSKSDDLFHKGLLLMRLTGIRVGELANLSFQCLKATPDGHKFLKVPLGKLNTERLVPLNQKAVSLVRDIQERSASYVNRLPSHLLVTTTGKQAQTHLLMNAFKEIVEDLDAGEPIVTHRMRHTYATELLAAGFNIWALKDILGHRDIKMTLNYAAVTQEKVREEYFAAMSRLKDHIHIDKTAPTREPNEINYSDILKDLTLEIKKRGPLKELPPKRLLHLTKRIDRLKKDLEVVLL